MVERKVYLYSTDILVSSGKGGNGCVSFRREALVPKGGPDGGDGGRGGAVYVVASKKLETIVDFKHKRVFRAQNGRDGSGNDRTGASGENLTITVPLGTQIWSEGKLLFDLMDERPRLLLRGGKGGLGNQHFATPDLQAPYIATEGEPGKEITVLLVLKHLADIGVIGMPNAGKSTLVYKLSRAPVKIGDYAFSTIEPVLGVIKKARTVGIIDNSSQYPIQEESQIELEEQSLQHTQELQGKAPHRSNFSDNEGCTRSEITDLGTNKRSVEEEILHLELRLLKHGARKAITELDQLLAEDFIEIGVCGQMYDKQDLLNELPEERQCKLKRLSHFRISALYDQLVLATYTLEEDEIVSLRSSLWRKEEKGYQLVMHRWTLATSVGKATKAENSQPIEEVTGRNAGLTARKEEFIVEMSEANGIRIKPVINDTMDSDDTEKPGGLSDDAHLGDPNTRHAPIQELPEEIESGATEEKEDKRNDQKLVMADIELETDEPGSLGLEKTNSELSDQPEAMEAEEAEHPPALSERLIIADLPGLIEGSHRNVGLGHRFLQHLYRCKLLLHVVDGSDQNALSNFNTIIDEVKLYDPLLLEKPQLVCISKADLALPEQLLELELQLRSMGYEAMILSADYGELIERLFG